MRDINTVVERDWRCLYCERVFEGRTPLSEHYLSNHVEAFSAEELNMARSRRTRIMQDVERSYIDSEP
jgi:hypothetical protein